MKFPSLQFLHRDPADGPPRNPMRPLAIAGILIVVIFGGVGAWSATAPIDSAVVAPGVIAVESERRNVAHLEGGIVAEILVKEGQAVKAGQVLMRLDETRVRAQDEVVRAERYAQVAIEARLVAERDEQATLEFPAELMARASERKIAQILSLQRSQFEVRRTAIVGQRMILQQRVQQLDEQIAGLRALQESKRRQLGFIEEEMKMLDPLVKAGHVTRQRYLSLQREASRLEGEAAEHISAVAKAQQAIGETRLQILQLDNDRRQEIAKELREVQGKMFEATERLTASDDQLKRLDVVSPADGVVINLAYVTVGGVVPPGGTILSVVPSNDAVVIQAQVSPAEVDTVRPGQPVNIRFVTVAARQVPVLQGTVQYVSADRLTNEPRPSANAAMPALVPNAFYTARILVERSELAKLDQVTLHTGMPVEVLITRGERTVLQYIMSPLSNNFARAFKEQ